jgi:phenylpropionate dioxygenase-like ring-hydroxylating dioxygenase large terminal subunit
MKPHLRSRIDTLHEEVVTALREGVTLGPHWYSDPEIFELEQEAVFNHGWQYAGHISQVEKVGDHFPCVAGRTPIAVVRDRESELRAFVNVCRHRGHEVVRSAGCRKTLQCHYHGWVFNLDGTLRSAPRSERELAFDKQAWPLFPAGLDTWGPLIFVNPDADSQPMATLFSEAFEAAAGRGLDMSGMVLRDRSTYRCRCNWKVMLDNMLECYHCPTGHPGFYEYYNIDPERYQIDVFRACSYQRGNLREFEAARAHKVDWGDFELYYVWPNTILIPGPISCIVLPMVPISPTESMLIAETYVNPEVDEAIWRPYIEYYDEIWHEDVELIESVQRGQDSGRLPYGPLLTDSERLLQHVQSLLAADIRRLGEREAATSPISG